MTGCPVSGLLARLDEARHEVAVTIIADDEGYEPEFLADCLQELTGERLTADELADHRTADCACNPD